MEEWNYLDLFMKKFNKALLDTASISREHERLTDENETLKSVLKHYLQASTAYSGPDGVLDRAARTPRVAVSCRWPFV